MPPTSVPGDQPQARTSLVWRKPGRGRIQWDLERRGLTHVSPLSLPHTEDNEKPSSRASGRRLPRGGSACLENPGKRARMEVVHPRMRLATPFRALPRENLAEVPTHSPSDK
ncbi:hypothetical protein J6590_087453 [Homalodisca vitripennis]|nr:hypothetical protein J6590_087453 [Homalodisca vitripennis]